MNLKQFCINNLKELQFHKGHSRDDLFIEAIRSRLDKSYDSYLHDIESSMGYLKRRNELRLMKKLNKK